MNKRPAKPANAAWLSPYLTVKDADAAIDFYQKAFGFEKCFSLSGPDGRTGHVEMRWHEAVIMFGPECPQNKGQSPTTTGVRAPLVLYVYCDDVDALFKRATAAGAKVDSPPTDQFYGDRSCGLIDPDGFVWMFATNTADFDPAKSPWKAS